MSNSAIVHDDLHFGDFPDPGIPVDDIQIIESVDLTDYVNFNSSGILFCLDDNPMKIKPICEDALFVKIFMKMRFEGFGVPEYIVCQDYEYVLTEEGCVAYPGEEVQDFFMDGDNLVPDFFSQFKEFFKIAVVTMSVKQFNSEKTEVGSCLIKNVLYMPGQKPLAYPYLTNSTVRTTCPDSLIVLCALGRDFNETFNDIANLQMSASFQNSVYLLPITRETLDQKYGPNDVIASGLLRLEPKPSSGDTIPLLFINQNQCIDWFSFTDEWEEQPELEHILSYKCRENLIFKPQVKSKTILRLNTGWLFDEEKLLLNELMESKVCYVKRGEKWERFIPISKKPMPYSSDRNLNSQIVEFQKVKENER